MIKKEKNLLLVTVLVLSYKSRHSRRRIKFGELSINQ